ncbi:MAG: nucleoside/nucleotide kinase family protein [Rhizobiaceae bacterium]|jgi:pantothenate kinase|nr:nucleoside/nucleotide kinase family protein [Rhizobiaceae bacterium]
MAAPDEPVAALAERVAEAVTAAASRALAHGGQRFILAVAGPPGSGKSTLADAVAALLTLRKLDAAVFPMDGYHYDDAILNARGHRPRKGAPHTFDVDGFAATLKRLKAEQHRDIAVPVFDRDLEVSRGSARIIAASTRIIVAEGNYLLLDAVPWRELRPHFDLSVFIREPEAVLRARLEDRWRHYQFTAAEMQQKLEGNDMPNVRLVLERSAGATLEVGGAARG